MLGSAKLMVHAPYRYISRDTIECSSASASKDLKKYYIKKIGTSNGELLFDRTMKYCGTTKGWFLNKDAAKLFNIIAYSSLLILILNLFLKRNEINKNLFLILNIPLFLYLPFFLFNLIKNIYFLFKLIYSN